MELQDWREALAYCRLTIPVYQSTSHFNSNPQLEIYSSLPSVLTVVGASGFQTEILCMAFIILLFSSKIIIRVCSICSRNGHVPKCYGNGIKFCTRKKFGITWKQKDREGRAKIMYVCWYKFTYPQDEIAAWNKIEGYDSHLKF